MIIALARICYKSKCRQVDICCVHVFRDTVLEVQEEANRIDHLPPAGSNSPTSPGILGSNRLRELGMRKQNSDSMIDSTRQIDNV